MSIRPLDDVTSPEQVAPAPGRSGLVGAVIEHLQDPMRRNSYALIVGTGLTSALGLLFWALAARWLPDSTVGVGAALVSAITLLANFSTLGLRNGLVRFLPAAGSRGRRLIAVSYALCVGAAIILATVFLIGQPLWAEKLGFLRESPQTVVLFVSAVAVWVIFVLQDNALLGTQRALWIPVANGICSIGKIVLLPVLAFSAVWAIFAATVLPAAGAVVLITVLLLRRPKTAPAGEDAPIPVGRLARFAATDHLSALLWLGTSDILTLVILQAMGPEASAYYFIAATIGYSLYLITSNVGSALVAEGARHPERAVALARQAALHAARLVIPLAIVGALLAPFVLGLLGPSYAANGTLLLQFVLASAVPQIIVSVAMSAARLRHDLTLIMILYGLQSVGMLGGSYLLIGHFGLSGVGFACLGTATLIAVLLLVTGRTGLWPSAREHGGLRSRLVEVVLGLGAARRRRGARAALRRRLPAAQAALGLPVDPTGSLLTSDCDTVIFAPRSQPESLIKIATSAAAGEGLERHEAALRRVTGDRWPASWQRLVPTVRRRVQVDGLPVLLESRLPGRSVTADTDQADPAVTAAALGVLTRLHAATSAFHVVDDALLDAWVREPLAQLRRHPELSGHPGLDRTESILVAALAHRRVRTGATHGDFWPGNVLIDDDHSRRPGGAVVVTGIVDWENAREIGLPDLDLLHWWLVTQPGELGTAVTAVLADPASAETRLAEFPGLLINADLGLEHLVLLTWLGHVADGLRRASRNRLGLVWLKRNVRPVLDQVSGAPERRPA